MPDRSWDRGQPGSELLPSTEVSTTTTTTAPIDNGVDFEFLRGARELLTGQLEAATFRWRVTNTWVNGTRGQSAVKDFFGLGAEQSHHTEFVFDGDHPEQFGKRRWPAIRTSGGS